MTWSLSLSHSVAVSVSLRLSAPDSLCLSDLVGLCAVAVPVSALCVSLSVDSVDSVVALPASALCLSVSLCFLSLSLCFLSLSVVLVSLVSVALPQCGPRCLAQM